MVQNSNETTLEGTTLIRRYVFCHWDCSPESIWLHHISMGDNPQMLGLVVQVSCVLYMSIVTTMRMLRHKIVPFFHCRFLGMRLHWTYGCWVAYQQQWNSVIRDLKIMTSQWLLQPVTISGMMSVMYTSRTWSHCFKAMTVQPFQQPKWSCTSACMWDFAYSHHSCPSLQKNYFRGFLI